MKLVRKISLAAVTPLAALGAAAAFAPVAPESGSAAGPIVWAAELICRATSLFA